MTKLAVCLALAPLALGQTDQGMCVVGETCGCQWEATGIGGPNAGVYNDVTSFTACRTTCEASDGAAALVYNSAVQRCWCKAVYDRANLNENAPDTATAMVFCRTPEPTPAPTAEPIPEPPLEMAPAAPEFQIFTSPAAMRLLNGLMSLVDYGVQACADGFGVDLITRYYGAEITEQIPRQQCDATMITSSDVHTHHNRRCRLRLAQYHMEMTISNILRDK
jgi:hypothetical protein